MLADRPSSQYDPSRPPTVFRTLGTLEAGARGLEQRVPSAPLPLALPHTTPQTQRRGRPDAPPPPISVELGLGLIGLCFSIIMPKLCRCFRPKYSCYSRYTPLICMGRHNPGIMNRHNRTNQEHNPISPSSGAPPLPPPSPRGRPGGVIASPRRGLAGSQRRGLVRCAIKSSCL